MSEQHAKDLKTVAEEIQQIGRLMEEMQSLSRTRNEEMGKSIVSLTDLISQTARLYSHVLERKKTTLEVVVPQTPPLVYVNPAQMSQVLYNLLQNARNHTEGGKVTIHADYTPHGGQETVSVTVSDTGQGITSELLPRVFERGIIGKDGGMGIGLALCKEIITAHGGTIEIKSELGIGTEVTFTLPTYKGGGNDGK